MGNVFGAMAVAPDQPVAIRDSTGRTVPFEQIRALDALQGTAGLDDPDPLDAGQKDTHHFLVTEHVPTEQCERIVMPCLQEFLQVPGDIPGRFIVGI